jgi:hypothetical protein
MDDYSELAGETPDAMQGIRLNLADLGGAAAELSTGLVLTWRDRLVFALIPHAIPLGAQGQEDVAAFSGIGGHLEPGEQWTAAVVREAKEETCCDVSLGDSAVTYFCRQTYEPTPIAFRWDEPCRPLLVWVSEMNLRRGPNGERMPVTLVNAVFRAAALGRPIPCAEIQTLILLDHDMLVHAYARPRPLGDLLAMGAEIVGEPVPPETLVAPGGTAYFYAQWLAWQAGG